MEQPTETELLILNSIIYTNDFAELTQYEKEDFSIYDWAVQFNVNTIDNNNKPAGISQNEFKNIINTILHNKDVYDSMNIKNIDNGKYDIRNDNPKVTNATISYKGNTIIIYKGTASHIDWRDNGVGAYSSIADTVQQTNALRYFDAMYELHGTGNIYVTGHSKGGNKAQYVTVLRGDVIQHAYSFDGQGFGFPFIHKYQAEISSYNHKITNICNTLDFVSILLQPIAGNTKYIKDSSTYGFSNLELKEFFRWLVNPNWFLYQNATMLLSHKIGGWHSPYTMLTLDINRNLILDKQVEQSTMMQELAEFLNYSHMFMQEDDWRYLCYMLMTVMMNNTDTYGGVYDVMPDQFFKRLSALVLMYAQKHKELDIAFLYSVTSPRGYSMLVRDFSDTVKQEILCIISAVESEPWWNPFKWNIWYHIQDMVGWLDLPSDGVGLHEYYRKVIDKDAIGISEIERIFAEVYEVEYNFNQHILALKGTSDTILLALQRVNTLFE